VPSRRDLHDPPRRGRDLPLLLRWPEQPRDKVRLGAPCRCVPVAADIEVVDARCDLSEPKEPWRSLGSAAVAVPMFLTMVPVAGPGVVWAQLRRSAPGRLWVGAKEATVFELPRSRAGGRGLPVVGDYLRQPDESAAPSLAVPAAVRQRGPQAARWCTGAEAHRLDQRVVVILWQSVTRTSGAQATSGILLGVALRPCRPAVRRDVSRGLATFGRRAPGHEGDWLKALSITQFP
jgi:hypothetical protein